MTDEPGWGDYFKRYYDTWGSGTLIVYGRITPLDEIRAQEKECGAGPAEIEYEITKLTDAYTRGFRYGRCYSVTEPDGELGFTHVSVMRKISGEQFEEAEERGWR